MASIVQQVNNKNSISDTHSIISKDKKLSKPKRTSSTNLNFENELRLNKSIKPLNLNVSTKSLNNNHNKNSLIHSASSTHQNINSLFKLTSPTTSTFITNPYPSTKQNNKIYIRANEPSSDSETEIISNSSPDSNSNTPTESKPSSPKNKKQSNLNININSLLKDIKTFNFKYKNKPVFESNTKTFGPSHLKQHSNSPHSSSCENLEHLFNSLKTKSDSMESSTETLVVSSTDSIHTTTASLASLTLKDIALPSPTPPPKTKLPDLPSLPPRPAPKYLPPPPPLSKEDVNLGAFDIIKTIGTGSFGRVHLVKSKVNHKYYAMKAIPKSHIVKEQQVEHIREEKRILAELRHPLFIQLSGTFQTRTHLFMVMNYVAGGELFAVLKKKTRFINNIAKFYAAEVTIALEYLHSKDIIYRDLKPENIMLDVTGHIKLVDLGFAKLVPDVTYTLCGTPEYMAPEVILSKAYGKAVDWYALGILIYEMLCGYPPFYDQDQLQLYKKILSGKIYWPSYVIEEAKDLIQQLITPDLTKRFGNLKNGAEDIKQHSWFAGVEWTKVEKLDIAPPFIPEILTEGDTRHFQRYSEPCDKEYYESQDHEALLDHTNDYSELFKEF